MPGSGMILRASPCERETKMSRPRKKDRARDCPGAGEQTLDSIAESEFTELQDGESHKSTHFRLSPTWSIPPDDKDGFSVCIGGRGHVVLTQDRPFVGEVEIILHPGEARYLLQILPDAIEAAELKRGEGV